jgi:hypothetical protein
MDARRESFEAWTKPELFKSNWTSSSSPGRERRTGMKS